MSPTSPPLWCPCWAAPRMSRVCTRGTPLIDELHVGHVITVSDEACAVGLCATWCRKAVAPCSGEDVEALGEPKISQATSVLTLAQSFLVLS